MDDSHQKFQHDGESIQLPANFSMRNGQFRTDLETIQNFKTFQSFTEKPVSLQEVSTLLKFSNGVTFRREVGQNELTFRASPSASATYPIDIYLVAGNLEKIRNGLYFYDPLNHALQNGKVENITPDIIKACFNLSSLEKAAGYLVFTANFQRNSWRYQQRAFRYSMLEVGYILQNLSLTAANLGLALNIVGDFVDEDLNKILLINSSDEVSLLVVGFGSSTSDAAPEQYEFSMPVEEQDHIGEMSEDLQQEFYLKSSHYSPGQDMTIVKVSLPFRKEIVLTKPSEPLIELPDLQKNSFEPTLSVINSRRSSHFFSRTPIKMEELSEILRNLQTIPAMYNYKAYHTYLAVSDVENLENGLYIYHSSTHHLKLIKKGTFRGNISYLTLAQDAVFNCSVAIFFAVDFEEINIFSNRGYRYAHFNIGMLSESVYLSATAFSLGARGISNFFDDEINNFFELDNPTQHILGGIILGRS
jgi:SagB-type dehydrogenase family enzyme